MLLISRCHPEAKKPISGDYNGEEQQKLHMELVAQQRRIHNYCSPENSILHMVAKVLANTS